VFLMQLTNAIRVSLIRNKVVITVVAITFFAIIALSAVVAYAVLVTSPALTKGVENLVGSTRASIAIPPPYTKGFYSLIFLNNIGHFWNPLRIWVWAPFIGAFSLGYELLINAVLIGAVIAFTDLTRGALYTMAGLMPHGVFEIPAFILEFAGLARWHITATHALYEKLSGRNIDRPLLREGVGDTLLLSLLSVVLFAVAAYFESYVTPRFLGL
jgi:stage II sporulation protein M